MKMTSYPPVNSHSRLEYSYFQFEIHLQFGSIFHCSYVSLPEGNTIWQGNLLSYRWLRKRFSEELFYVIDLRFISVDVVYLYNWKEAWSTNSSILDTNPIDVAILTLVVFMFRQLACTRYLACSWMVSLKLHCWRCPVGRQKGTIQLLKLKPHIWLLDEFLVLCLLKRDHFKSCLPAILF